MSFKQTNNRFLWAWIFESNIFEKWPIPSMQLLW